MELRNNTISYQKSPNFGANTAKELVTLLKKEGANMSEKIDAKVKTIKLWGDKSSNITTSFDLEAGKMDLSLFNDRLSTVRGAGLPQRKGNLVESFLDLEERDILNAEEKIKQDIVANRQNLMVEKVNDMGFVRQVTGKPDPTVSEYTEAVNNLSDEAVTELRFGKEQPAETGSLIDFNV